jgi:hypothetical protein
VTDGQCRGVPNAKGKSITVIAYGGVVDERLALKWATFFSEKYFFSENIKGGGTIISTG